MPHSEVEQARIDLKNYERDNGDISPATRRLLALSWLGSKYGRKVMEYVLGQSLPRTPFRDSSWRWWTCLRLSGMEDKWDGFKDLAERDGLRKAMQWLRANTDPATLSIFQKRAGQGLHNTGGRKPKGQFVWTKGGQWHKHMPMTKLLVLNQHLPPRHKHKPWQRRLGDDGVHRLESEVMALINPDIVFPHEAKWTAVQYVRRRIPELVGGRGYRSGSASQAAAAWFFNQTLPTEDGYGYIAIRPNGRTHTFVDKTQRCARIWDW